MKIGTMRNSRATILKASLRSEEHTSELQSHRDLHSFPTRRSSDLDDVREMPHGCRNADHVDDEDRHHAKLTRDDIKGVVVMCRDRLIVESWYQAKPEVEHVKC